MLLNLRARDQHGGVGAVRVTGGDDSPSVEQRAGWGGQHRVERKPKVLHPIERLRSLRRIAQAGRQGKRIARPDLTVAAHMLHMQAAIPVSGKVTTEVAVSVP